MPIRFGCKSAYLVIKYTISDHVYMSACNQMGWKLPLMKRSNSAIETPAKKPVSPPSLFRRWKSLSGILRPHHKLETENVRSMSRFEAKHNHILSSQAMTASSPRNSYTLDSLRLNLYDSNPQSPCCSLPRRSSNLLAPEFVMDLFLEPTYTASSIPSRITEISLLDTSALTMMK